MMLPLVWLVSIVLGLLRVFGCKTQVFQAVAHLWVGGLFAAWWCGAPRWATLAPFAVLCVAEVVCFACDKLGVTPAGDDLQ